MAVVFLSSLCVQSLLDWLPSPSWLLCAPSKQSLISHLLDLRAVYYFAK